MLYIETETGIEEVHKRPSDSPNYYHLRKLLSSVIYGTKHKKALLKVSGT